MALVHLGDDYILGREYLCLGGSSVRSERPVTWTELRAYGRTFSQ